MHSIALEQLRTANLVGGISNVTLKGQGGVFFVQIAMRSGSNAVLAKARSSEPRCFGNPAVALSVLRGVGITVGQFDASEWNPADRKPAPGTSGRAEALRKAHQAAAYSEWLASEIQDAINDPRPNLSHEEVLTGMDADIAALASRPVEKERA
jgi:hypothetical protein